MKRKRLLVTMLAVSMMFSGIPRLTAKATESDNTGNGLITDDTNPITVEIPAAKNVVDTTIHVDRDPSVSAYSFGNTDINNAEAITVNSMNYDMIAEAGQQRWYLFWSDAGKLTLDLTAPDSTNVDYDVYLYQYSDDDGGTVTLIDGSENNNSADEHVARMIEEGVYFVLVNGYSGYDANHSFRLGVGYSNNLDSAEIDDHFNASTAVSVPFSVTGTIDNAYDHDYIKFTVTEESKMAFSVVNNGSSGNAYRMNLYNGAGISLGYVPEGYQGTVTLSAGNYYARMYATAYGGDDTSTYTVTGTIEEIPASAARVNVTKAGDAFIDYGYGKFWRISNSAVVTGTAYDASGYPIANANIEIQVDVVPGNTTRVASGTTDSQGNFSINLYLGYGLGQNKYDSGVSYHYYDIVPIRFYSNGTRITSNISYIYHFAYQEMHDF